MEEDFLIVARMCWTPFYTSGRLAFGWLHFGSHYLRDLATREANYKANSLFDWLVLSGSFARHMRSVSICSWHGFYHCGWCNCKYNICDMSCCCLIFPHNLTLEQARATKTQQSTISVILLYQNNQKKILFLSVGVPGEFG